jgi:DNA-binding HxlR family transcriptional regulator
VACTLDILGDRWTLLVIRDLFRGKSQFKEFLRAPERIASNVLSDRLNRLVQEGLVEKTPLPDLAVREGYRLTPKGHSLGPVLKAVAEWGLANVEGAEARLSVDTGTGH